MRLPGRLLAGVLILAVAAALDVTSDLRAQQDAPADRPTFRASANLVTVDAVVTDRDGRHVVDLTADDFEIAHKGTPQRLQHAVYVPLAGRPGRGRQSPRSRVWPSPPTSRRRF